MNYLGNLVWGMQLGEYFEEILVTAICEEKDQSDDNFDKEVSLVAAILTDTVFKGWDTTLGE